MQTHRRWQSYWRSEAVTRVAAVASSGLGSIGLRPFAVWGLLGLALAVGLCVMSASAVQQAPDKAKERVIKKEVTGLVVATTSRALSLETSRTGGHIEEMLIPVDPSTVTFERVKSMADLHRGDKVLVEYQVTYREDDQGQERLAGVSATTITWLNRGMPTATVGLTSDSTDGTP